MVFQCKSVLGSIDSNWYLQTIEWKYPTVRGKVLLIYQKNYIFLVDLIVTNHLALSSMKYSFLLLIVVCVATTVLAQNLKFGKVSLEELKTSRCPIDSSADAYVIGEYGETCFDVSGNRFKLYFDYTIRIKILKKSGFEWASANIGYQREMLNREDIVAFRAVTYNLVDGEITEDKLAKDAVFEEQKSKTYFNRKFTMPNVKEGSVIEYTYTIASDYYTIKTWTFQTSIPTLWSQYKVRVPQYFRYSLNAQGYEPFAVSKQEKSNMTLTIGTDTENITATDYEFAVRNAPAIRNEAYITTIDDYVSKITFELASYAIVGQVYKSFSNTIKAINTTLWRYEDFGEQIGKITFLDGYLGKMLVESDTIQKIRMAINLVQSQVRWNKEESIFTSDNPQKIFEQHSGNVTDVNLMLVGLLKKLKLPVYPAILSTRANGRLITNNPQIKNFDYTIAVVDMGGGYLFLDATEPLLKMGVLPERCLNHAALVLKKDQAPEWIEVNPSERFVSSTTIYLQLNDEGVLTGQINNSENGYAAVEERKSAILLTKEKTEENLRKKHPNWDIKSIKVLNADSLHKSFEVKFDLTTSEGVNVAGNRIYLKPFVDGCYEKNPFQMPERKYPVDFAALIDDNILVNITLPDGYVVEELPKNEVVNLPEGAARFLCAWQANGQTIQVSSRLSIKKTVFYAEEYTYLREFFDKIVAKHATQIVLKKK